IDSLVALARDADLVVGGGAQMAAPTAALCHGVPYRYVCYCPALLPSVEHPPILVSWDNERRWLNRLLWPLMLGPISLLLRPLFRPAPPGARPPPAPPAVPTHARPAPAPRGRRDPLGAAGRLADRGRPGSGAAAARRRAASAEARRVPGGRPGARLRRI